METRLQQETAGMSIVRQTNLEKLVARAEESKEKQRKKEELARQDNRRKNDRERLLRRIASVYFFIRHGLGLAHEAISIEEFEAAEKKLDEMAPEKCKRWIIRHPWLALWTVALSNYSSSAWHSYKYTGYFSSRSKPFDSMGYCNFGNYMPDDYIIESFAKNDSYPHHMETIVMSNSMTIPPNIETLFRELWKKRCAHVEKELAQITTKT